MLLTFFCEILESSKMYLFALLVLVLSIGNGCQINHQVLYRLHLITVKAVKSNKNCSKSVSKVIEVIFLFLEAVYNMY